MAAVFRLLQRAEKRKPGIWIGTLRLTSAWLRLPSEPRLAAGMSMKGYAFFHEMV